MSRKSRAASVALQPASTGLHIELTIPYHTAGATLLRCPFLGLKRLPSYISAHYEPRSSAALRGDTAC